MFRPRIIPVLLLKDQVLVKSTAFKDYRYIGDPINAVRIFNRKKADELVFLDIQATSQNRTIPLEFVRDVGAEASMPFAVGGGIRTLKHIRDILEAGAEKVIIGSYAAENPSFIRQAADTFGSSTIVVCIDVRKRLFGGLEVRTEGGRKVARQDPLELARSMQQMGAGELIVQSIDRDGAMKGYDIDLVRQISQAVTLPVVALGGAGNLSHLRAVYREGYANGLAAGSLFVFYGAHRGVLINYPEESERAL